MGGAVRGITNMVSSIFGGGESAPAPAPVYAPPPPPAAPTTSSADVQAAEQRQRVLAGKAQGRASTILTGGEGVTAEEDTAVTAKKKLLGS
jgi:hypothetical protein